jgi:hypothetical protein
MMKRMKMKINFDHHCDGCVFCKMQKEKLMKSLKIGVLFLVTLLLSPLIFAVSGSSTFFNLQPNCTVNVTSINNCSEQSIKMWCYEPTPQFVNFMVFNFNSTSYIAFELNPPNQYNFSVETTLKQQNETQNLIYNWSNVVVTDTANNIAIFLQGININKSCPDCFPLIVQVNSSCGSNDIKNVTYTDLHSCLEPLPSNYQVDCDFCDPNWQCSSYNPPTCGIDTKFRDCLAITDLNNCYAQTGLSSDNFTGQLDDFQATCGFSDWALNTTLLSTLDAELSVSQYPYVELNTTIDMMVTVKLADTNILISNVQMQIDNETIHFDQNNISKVYEKSIMITEYGDYPFTVRGRDGATQVFRIDGILFARKFADVTVELFEDRNMSDRYVNNFAEIVALKNYENFQADTFTNDLVNSIEPLNKANTFMGKLLRIDRDAYYRYHEDKRAFHTEYEDGVAVLRLPIENETIWELRLLNAESNLDYVFDGYNYAQIMTTDMTGSNDIYLTSGAVPSDLTIQLLVSRWDVRFMQTATKWIVVGILLLIFIGAGYFATVSTGDPTLAIRLAIAGLVALPTIWLILKWILG